MRIEKTSPCKVNLLLNILGKRPDGFHELETVMQPIALFDLIQIEIKGNQIELTCNDTNLPTDSQNLVHRAAAAFLSAVQSTAGIRIHLEKKIPMQAGLGGGSGNAATTLLGLNELFGEPLSAKQLHEIASSLGSDIPFFLQSRPALAKGRGEIIEPLEPFRALKGTYIFLVHPGFGISTPWAYQQLLHFPAALNGIPGRAENLISLLQKDDLRAASQEIYNSLEAPALRKYPILLLFQEFLKAHGAPVSLMSGSGSSTFAIFPGRAIAEAAVEKFKATFGTKFWSTLLPMGL